MPWWNSLARIWLPALLACAWLTAPSPAQQPGATGPYRPDPRGVPLHPRTDYSQRPVQPRGPARLAERPSPPQERASPPQERASPPQERPSQIFAVPQPGEHPLMPAIRWARQGVKHLEQIKDYSATMIKRERIGGKLGDYEHMFVKVRHQPLSVYMYFLGPEEFRGREVIYVQGKNDGLMWAHGTGLQRTMFGTVSLKPTGPIAMKGQRYPLTEIGMLNMLRRLIEVGEKDIQYGECEVKFFEGAKINDRSCTCIQVVHPVPRRNFLFHIARIFADDELNLPVRYEAYDWPKEPGGPPELTEEYTYVNIKLNNGFTDADFDVRNSNYQFP